MIAIDVHTCWPESPTVAPLPPLLNLLLLLLAAVAVKHRPRVQPSDPHLYIHPCRMYVLVLCNSILLSDV